MKQTTKIFFILLIGSAIFLSACQKQSDVSTVAGNNILPTDAFQKEKLSTEEMLKYQAQLGEIVKTGDIAKCAEIESMIYFNSCSVQILAHRALREKKIEVCQEGLSSDIKENCTAYFSQLLKTLQAGPAEAVVTEKVSE